MKQGFMMAAFLIMHYNLLDAHVVDIHINTPSEIAEEQRRDEERETEKDREIYEDETKSDEERYEALERLNDKGEIV